MVFVAYPALYKFAASGATQQWNIKAEKRDDSSASYTTTHGLVGGSLQETTVEILVGKNIGKANETTPFEQAQAEALSKWNKKKDRKGYAENKPKKVAAISPMLAKSYEKEKKKVKFPCAFQPKLDGMRCIAQKKGGKVKLFSRQGKDIDTLPHIVSILEERMKDGEVVDGELYIHSKAVTFQTLLSWIKRAQSDTKKVQYHVYDLVSSQPYPLRFKRLCQLVGKSGKGIIKTVFTDVVVDSDDVQAKLAEQITRGYEGIMLRLNDCEYRSGRRSSELLKVKNFVENEYPIVGIKEGVGKCAGQAIFICETDDGKRFSAKIMGTDAEREEYWNNKNKYIGEELTVKYFELTDDGIPRFPVGKTIRKLVEG